MKIGGTSDVNGPQRIYPRQGKGAEPGPAPRQPAPPSDRVEISDAARLSEALSRIPDIRLDKVAAARQLIAAGQMDTPQRMDAAIDRLLNELPAE